MSDVTKIQYQVRPVTRYIVTRYEESTTDVVGIGEPSPAKRHRSDVKGEFDNKEAADAVAYALCRAEHEALGWLPGDERIVYPSAASDEAAERLRKANADMQNVSYSSSVGHAMRWGLI